MKEIKLLTVLLVCSAAIFTVTGCKPEGNHPLAEGFWAGMRHEFENAEVVLDETGNATHVTADLQGGGTVDLYVDAAATGTFNFGNNANLSIYYGGNYYYSNAMGTIGTINITKIDSKKKWIEMDFSATLTDIANTNQTLEITQGVVNQKFTISR